MNKSAISQVWSCKEGVLRLELPTYSAYFSMDHDKFLSCVRGNLSISDFLRYVHKFLVVYKNMI